MLFRMAKVALWRAATRPVLGRDAATRGIEAGGGTGEGGGDDISDQIDNVADGRSQ